MSTEPTSRVHEDESSQVLATGERTIHHIPVLTVKKLAEKFAEIEKTIGYERALLCVEMLDYGSLRLLVEQGGEDNDPNLMPSRYCILPGASDKGLKAKGNLDPFGPKDGTPKYELHPGAPHTMSVQNLADLLVFGGFLQGGYPSWTKSLPGAYDTSEAEPRKFEEMDDELVDALSAYIAQGSTPFPDWELPESYEVDENDSLSSIARELGIRNWRLIWEMNKDVLGDKWDRPPVKAKLKLPDPTKDPLGEDDSFAEWLDGYSSPLRFADKGYQYPGMYLSLTILDDQNNVAKFDKPTLFSVHLRGAPPVLIHHVEVKQGDEIDFVVPDGPNVSWGLQGNPMSSLGMAWFYYTEDNWEESPPEGLDRNRFDSAGEIFKKHTDSIKAKQK